MVTPTLFGAQPISQQMTTYLSGIDYMTDEVTFQQVQNGIDTGLSVQIDPQLRFLDNGRDLGAYTRVDVLFQAYFVAFLVCATMGVPSIPAILTSPRQNKMASAPLADPTLLRRFVQSPAVPRSCLAPKVVTPPPPPSRVGRRNRPTDLDRQRGHPHGSRQRQRAQFPGRPGELQ